MNAKEALEVSLSAEAQKIKFAKIGEAINQERIIAEKAILDSASNGETSVIVRGVMGYSLCEDVVSWLREIGYTVESRFVSGTCISWGNGE